MQHVGGTRYSVKQLMKQMIKKVARRFGYDLVQDAALPVHAFNVLDFVVNTMVDEIRQRGVIQIGANDGVRNDPIHALVMRHCLPGLFVEPLPDVFLRLRSNYVGQMGLRFENSAIGEHDGEGMLYRVPPAADLPEWIQGIASFHKAHLTSRKFGIPHLESRVIAESVPVISIATLLEKHGLQDAGLLQVDTEGFDCRIVTWAMAAGLRPRVINYEFIHTPPQERAECKRLLMRCGYRFVDAGRDTLAVLDEVQ